MPYRDFAFGENEPAVVKLTEAFHHAAVELIPLDQKGVRTIEVSDANALGSYCSLSVAQGIQFFSCDLQCDLGFKTRHTSPSTTEADK